MAPEAHPRRVLKTPFAAQYLGLSPSWLRKKRLRGVDDPSDPGPPYIKLPGGICVYEISDLDAWLDERKVRFRSR